MKGILRLLLLLLLCNSAHAGEKEDIFTLVYHWNELHNNHQTEMFRQIYAADVLFYGRNKNRNTCVRSKEEFLTNSDFRQDIISPINLTWYSSGVVKCSFIKKTTLQNLSRKHDCYLLVKKQDGQWLVTGESDLVTDKNLHVQPDLGEELVSTRTSKASYVIGGLALLTLSGFVVYRRRKSSNRPPLDPVVQESNHEPVLEPKQAPVSAFAPEEMVTLVKEAVLQEMKTAVVAEPKEAGEKEKGLAFEEYVVSRFSKEYFKLKEWRSDKYHQGVYPTSSQLPDLEYHFQTNYHEAMFAIECKWRSEFTKGRIEWARSYQLVNYRDYERKHRIPVFVVIGVGGTPDSPQSVYIVPLRDIRSNVLSENQLKPYYRHRSGNFYLNLGPDLFLE